METRFSREQFDGYTHRFIVEFEIGKTHQPSLQIYTNTNSYQELDNFINEKKTDKVKNFTIVHRSSKEQDDMITEFLNEL